MKTFRRPSETVNAGSMADISFLLLIFFLVTTTISADKGILRKLPRECPPGTSCDTNVPERNLLRIVLNENQEILIEDELVTIGDVKKLVKLFIDNNGASDCNYCNGEQLEYYSDHPKEAIISLGHDALTKYDLFISVEDEIIKAFYDLRAHYAQKTYNKNPIELNTGELNAVKKAYPVVVTELMVKRSN